MSTLTLDLDIPGNVPPPEDLNSDAVISPCGKYRYTLTRIWDREKPRVCFVMLNPSTADAKQDDPTIRRCIGFAKQWGFGSLEVVNLFAFRATDPKALMFAVDPVGPMNDVWLGFGTGRSECVVAAWGADPAVRTLSVKTAFLPRWKEVTRIIRQNRDSEVYCLGTTREGHPRHPLYIANTQARIPFRGDADA